MLLSSDANELAKLTMAIFLDYVFEIEQWEPKFDILVTASWEWRKQISGRIYFIIYYYQYLFIIFYLYIYFYFYIYFEVYFYFLFFLFYCRSSVIRSSVRLNGSPCDDR